MVQLFYKPSQSPLFLSTLPLSLLSLPLEHLISLWSSVFSPSFSFSLSLPHVSPSPPLCLPHHSSCCCYCLPHPLPFSFPLPLWSALRVLFIQQQPTQSRVEQSRAGMGVWLTKVGITSETQQNYSLLYSIFPYTAPVLSLYLITTSLFILSDWHNIFNSSIAGSWNGGLSISCRSTADWGDKK